MREVMPSRMSKAGRRRMWGVNGDRGKVEERLREMKGIRGKWSAGTKAEYGALMRELRRLEGLTDGLRLEREEFDEYLRKRREEDAKWRAGGTCERKEERRSGAVGGGTLVLTVDQAALVDENRRLRAQLRERST